MLDIFNTPTPRGANYQEFYGGGTTRDWIKPRGASMVRMLLIGGGGGGGRNTGAGATGKGGGSAAITSWIGPAIFIPDQLRIFVAAGGTNAGASAGGTTSVIYQAKDGTGYTLLTANGGQGGTGGIGAAAAGGTASANNFFGAAGIFTSIAGQTSQGAGNANPTPTTTFLTAGTTASSSGGLPQNPNYGYPAIPLGGASSDGQPGYFLTQPIMLGVGGQGSGASTVGGNGGIGCGGGGAATAGFAAGRGGDGAVFIWAW